MNKDEYELSEQDLDLVTAGIPIDEAKRRLEELKKQIINNNEKDSSELSAEELDSITAGIQRH